MFAHMNVLCMFCKAGDKPAGSAKCQDKLTLLIITNMDGTGYRKMAVNWYASKNALMTEDIYHKIMTKFNNQI